MRAFGRALLAVGLGLGLGFVVPALSQQAKRDRADPPKVLTGKERLGPKWTDEQRIDNCNVPIEKRGSKPRPSACTQATTDF